MKLTRSWSLIPAFAAALAASACASSATPESAAETSLPPTEVAVSAAPNPFEASTEPGVSADEASGQAEVPTGSPFCQAIERNRATFDAFATSIETSGSLPMASQEVPAAAVLWEELLPLVNDPFVVTMIETLAGGTDEYGRDAFTALSDAVTAECVDGNYATYSEPSPQLDAGELRIWISTYREASADGDRARQLIIAFCTPGATTTTWQISRDEAIQVYDTSGALLEDAAWRDYHAPGIVELPPCSGFDQDRELETRVHLVGRTETGDRVPSPDVARVVITADSGASVTFTSEDIPSLTR